MSKAIIFAIAILLIAVGAVYTAGKFSEPEWSGVRSAVYDEKVEILFKVISDPALIKKRKRGIELIEIIETNGGLITWKENLKDGKYRIFKEVEKNTPSRVAIELVESPNGITGFWEYNISSVGGGTKVVIEEKSYTPDLWTRGIMVLRGRNTLLRQEHSSLRKGLVKYLIEND